MSEKLFTTRSVAETEKLAADIAGKLKGGEVLALLGDLGAGKTTFVRGLAKALGVSSKEYVRSPTFTLMNVYQGRFPLYHFDFYRLNEAGSFEQLGFEEHFAGEGISVIEWAEKFPHILPAQHFKLHFKVIDENTREIIVPAQLL